jgi:hypothetical protein
MNGHGILWILVICLGQLLASKIHILLKFCGLLDFYLPTEEKIAQPCTSNMAQKVLSSQL